MKKEYCDLCGKEARTFSRTIPISFYGEEKNVKTFDVCENCIGKLNKHIEKAYTDFIHETNWWKENATNNGDIYHGSFHMIGIPEYGGSYKCPRCGYSNNAYTFKNKCQACGYEIV